MRKSFRLVALLFVACLGASLNGFAQTPASCPPAAQSLTPQQTQAGLQSARDRGLLWRIRKDGHASYLYGTVHVATVDWVFPGPTLMRAVRASDVVAVELDLLDPDILRRLRAGMAPKADRALPPALAERLRAQLQAACLPDALTSAMSPEMLATTLVVMAARTDGLDPAYGIDLVIAGLAHGLHKPVASLETPERQLDVLQGRNREETQAIVEQALAELESGKARPMLVRLARLWADSRFAELERYAQWCDCLNSADERAMHRRLLDERNPALAAQIDALHASGKSVFAAVGSLHMIGHNGLPALLAQRGYQVERVEFKP
ncbi:TraB/GumN family protein [Piscinibacter sp.]|jgi:hypothetical protein|uniref:TraB/GumN family protein n=1 Tax=Piscinibacter sp. TaxID=1903157 RepID=UPI002F408B78